jgi:hypothetical protein
VNGQPGALSIDGDGNVINVMALDIADGRDPGNPLDGEPGEARPPRPDSELVGPEGPSVRARASGGPARVRLALVGVVRRAVQVLAAHGAEAGAVLAADDLRRQGQRERVARPGAHVEVALVEVGRAELLAAARLVDLAGVDLDALVRASRGSARTAPRARRRSAAGRRSR